MILSSSNTPQLSVLIDPDKFNPALVDLANTCHVSYFFVGGSKLHKGDMESTLKKIRKLSDIPVIIFPGDITQISKQADALLLLSLLSGRNPEYLIGQHIKAAPIIKKKKISTIPTGYILVGNGKKSSTERITRTRPISPNDHKTIVHTAIAGELLGMKLIYLEGGSGAKNTIPAKAISEVKKNISIPLIVGGGIDSVKKARDIVKAGADMIVVGNALEQDIALLKELSVLF